MVSESDCLGSSGRLCVKTSQYPLIIFTELAAPEEDSALPRVSLAPVSMTVWTQNWELSPLCATPWDYRGLRRGQGNIWPSLGRTRSTCGPLSLMQGFAFWFGFANTATNYPGKDRRSRKLIKRGGKDSKKNILSAQNHSKLSGATSLPLWVGLNELKLDAQLRSRLISSLRA